MKLLRTIRLDDTDTRVYERAAAPGEWAVPGSFAEEVDYAAALCEHAPSTLLASTREHGEKGIVESLRVIRPNAGGHDGQRLFGPDPDPPGGG